MSSTRVATIIALATTLLAASPIRGAPQTVALSGGTVIRGTGGAVIPNGVVIVDGDRLSCVGTISECEIPADARLVDVSGRFITPGLVDAHVHFSQTGWIDGRPDVLQAPEIYPFVETSEYNRDNPDRWHRSYLCSGITAVYDVGGQPWTTGLPERSENDSNATHVRASGPLITHATRPALMVNDELYTFLPMDTPEEVSASVARLVDMGSSAVKVWYLSPSAARRDELDERLMQVA